jgi:hypothetical protein
LTQPVLVGKKTEGDRVLPGWCLGVVSIVRNAARRGASMSVTHSTIEALAPDQSALHAASQLLQAAKWPLRARAGGLLWGECQGSGANPYRVIADTEVPGTKCTCPSRKLPCKHALALMWMFVEDGAAFVTAAVPDWVHEWMSRRRKGAAAPTMSVGEAKSLDAARVVESRPPPDPEAEARRTAAAQKRAKETRRSVGAATEELDLWIADQLRAGVSGFLSDLSARCRQIAARLVDAKAGALASRIDEMPARLLALPVEERADAAIAELGKLVLLVRAWRATPHEPELRREVISSESRDELMNDPVALRVTSTWEIVGERSATRRDGLVSQSTWLMNLTDDTQRFALLIDFFPASAGRRSAAFAPGEQFTAELVFYHATRPLRAVIARREPAGDAAQSWPNPISGNPLSRYAEHLLAAPWQLETPLLLPQGRICQEKSGRNWWCSTDAAAALPLARAVPSFALGATIEAAAGIWDGARLSIIAAQTDWGRIGFDA